MAHPESFTGNPDADRYLLFSLPDTELLRLCSSNRYLQQLCTSSESEVHWQRRFEERFPNIQPVLEPGDTWRDMYWRVVQARGLSPAEILSIFNQRGVDKSMGPCILAYLRKLSVELDDVIKNLPPDDLHTRLALGGIGGMVLRRIRPDSSSRDYVKLIIDVVLTMLALQRVAPYTPWNITAAIAGDSSMLALLPTLTRELPILVRIGREQGIHLLGQQQFLGMLLYANYAAPGEVAFYLQSCPLHYTAREIKEIMQGMKPWAREQLELASHGLADQPELYTLHMPNGDVFDPITPEIMQGFITVARWLGRNYRLAYAYLSPW